MNYLINVRSLKERMEKLKIPKSYYSIGSYGEEALCIVLENNRWVVFEGEHGQRYNVHTFEEENEACLYFADRIRVFL